MTANRGPTPDRDAAMHERHRYYDALVAAGFPPIELRQLPSGGWESWSARAIPLATELTPSQRAAAELFAGVSGVHIDNLGIYSASWARRQWLGMDPPGPLFAERTFVLDGREQRLPTFHGLRALHREDEERALGYLAVMPILERLEVVSELTLAAIDYWDDRALGLLDTMRKELRDEGRAWAPAFADRLLGLFLDPHDMVERGNEQRIPADLASTVLIALVRAGIAIEPRWETLFAMWSSLPPRHVEEVIGALAESRRASALTALVDGVSFTNERIEWGLELLERHPYPSIARRILADVEDAQRPRDVLKALAAIGKRQPAIADVLREHEGRAKPIPALRFTERIKPRSAKALDAIGRAQLEEANGRYGGKSLTAEQIFETDESAEETILPAYLERWRVNEGKKWMYDAWLYMSDSGSIFEHGTTNVVAEVIQCGVESDDVTLRQALSQAMATRDRAPKKRAPKKRASKKKL
jgi:hypothetical protein